MDCVDVSEKENPLHKLKRFTAFSILDMHPANSHPRFHPRAILTGEQAIEIYQYQRTRPMRFKFDATLTGKASAVAEKYHISPKTVRDIWNRRTWTTETQHLWSTDEIPKIRKDNRSKLAHANSLESTSTDTTVTIRTPCASLDCRCSWNTAGHTEQFTSQTFCSVVPNMASYHIHHGDVVVDTSFFGGRTLSVHTVDSACSSFDIEESPQDLGFDDTEEGWALLGCLEATDDPFHADWPHW